MAALNEAVAAIDLATETPTIDLSDAVVEGIARHIQSDGFAVVDGALGDAHAAALRSSCLANVSCTRSAIPRCSPPPSGRLCTAELPRGPSM